MRKQLPFWRSSRKGMIHRTGKCLPVGVCLAAVVMIFIITGCDRPGPEKDLRTAHRVAVSIPPQAWFVEQIGGPAFTVDVLLPPGRSPATYDPSPSQIARLGEAAIWFRIGVPFESALIDRFRAAFPGLQVVDTTTGLSLRVMEQHGSHGLEKDDTPARNHAPGSTDQRSINRQPAEPADLHGSHRHEPGMKDPHTWLDPGLAGIQARTICDALCRLQPDQNEQFRSNLHRLLAELDTLDSRIRELLEPHQGQAIFVFHPAYGYFTDAYGLRQVAVESGGKEPGSRQLARLVELARREETKAIFVQPQFSSAAAETLCRELGAVVVPLDPLAREYSENLEMMARRIAEQLSGRNGEVTGEATGHGH